MLFWLTWQVELCKRRKALMVELEPKANWNHCPARRAILFLPQYYCQAGVKTLTHSGGSEMSVLHHHHFLQSSHCAFANRHHHHHLQITFKDQRHSPWKIILVCCAEIEDFMQSLRISCHLDTRLISPTRALIEKIHFAKLVNNTKPSRSSDRSNCIRGQHHLLW